MPEQTDIAYLRIELGSTEHSVADVSMIVEDLEGLITAAIWGSMLEREMRDGPLRRARQVLENSMSESKARARFYPGFTIHGTDGISLLNNEINRGFNPYNPLDAGLQIGLDAWFRRSIFKESPELFNELFSFASVRKLEHHSPLIVETVIVIGVLSTPVVLAYSLMKAASKARRDEAEARIREIEAEQKEEELKQMRLRTRMMKSITESIEELKAKDKLKIPNEAITKAVQVASPAIADLGENPLIKEVTFGVTAGNGKS